MVVKSEMLHVLIAMRQLPPQAKCLQIIINVANLLIVICAAIQGQLIV